MPELDPDGAPGPEDGSAAVDLDTLVERIAAAAAAPRGRRALVAVVGAPASGKSTLAATLAARVPRSVVVPMDGFHLDNALLDAAGTRAVKGAPHTFDAHGLGALLGRLRDGEPEVHVPLFDRRADLARAAAATVGPEHDTVLVEGNWLLLDREPWRALHTSFDLSVMLEIDEAVLRERLVERWLAHGLGTDAALARAETNDLPNGRLVAGASVPATLRLVP